MSLRREVWIGVACVMWMLLGRDALAVIQLMLMGAGPSVMAQGSLPAGAIVLIASGSCPATYVEETTLNGVLPLGTLAANGNIGTAGGADTITPQGVNSAPSFTGNALASHAHELPLHGGTTPRLTAGYGTGSSIAGTRSLTNAAQTTSQAVLLSQAVTAGTPAGAVSAPTFTGTQFDNRSAFRRVIFCRKT